jgi:hypothetical protein
MSKRFEKQAAKVRVQAVFTRFKKVRGEVTDTPLYDIYGPSYLKRYKTK